MKTSSLLALAFPFLAVIACAGSVELEDRACPCASGWTCCANENVCVTAGATCPAGSVSAGASAPVSLWTVSGVAAEPRCFGQDGEHLYWLDGEGHLFAVPKAGGDAVRSKFETPSQTMRLATEGHACTIAVDGAALYATMFGLGKILRVSLNTNGQWDLGREGELLGELTTPISVLVDGDTIWVAERDTGEIKRLAKTLGDAGTESQKGTSVIRVQGPIDNLLADGSSLIWSDAGGVRSMTKTGGSVLTLSTTSADALVRVDRTLYMGSTGKETFHSIPVTGGEATEIAWQEDAQDCGHEDGNRKVVIATWSGARALATDEKELLFVDATRVRRVPPTEARTTDLFSYRAPCGAPELEARLLAADATRIFWADGKTIWARTR